jgi:hypothetical protein
MGIILASGTFLSLLPIILHFLSSLPPSQKLELTHHRVILHLFVQATTTLLGNILSDPTHRRATSDLKLIEPLLSLLSALAKDGKSSEVSSMYEKIREMFESTRERVLLANSPVSGDGEFDGGEGAREKRGSGKEGEGGRNESLEEFLRRIESVSAGLDEEGMELVEQPSPHEESPAFSYLGANDLSAPKLSWHYSDGY